MIEKVIKFKASDGSLWTTEEEAVRYEVALLKHKQWAEVKDHIEECFMWDDDTVPEDVLTYIQDYTLFIYSELRKIIPKEQLKELDKEWHKISSE